MTSGRVDPRRLLRRAAAVMMLAPLLCAAVLALGSATAQAHALLTTTSPAQGSQVSAAPSTVTLTFTEAVGLSDRSVQVTDSRGRRVDDGKPEHPGGLDRSVAVALKSGLPTGSYTVTWRVVSADGHPVSGTFAFGVGVPAGTVNAAPTADPLVSALRTLTQFLSYAGAALIFGASVFLFWLWPGGLHSPRVRPLLVIGLAVAGAGALGALLVQGPYVAGASVTGLVDPGLLGETLGAGYGRALLLRVLAVALSVPVLGVWPALPDGEDAGPGGVAAAGNMLLLAASFSLTGHAAEASPRLLAEVADSLHLAAAGVWLGGLAVLLVAFLPDALDRLPRPAPARASAVPAGGASGGGAGGGAGRDAGHAGKLAAGDGPAPDAVLRRWTLVAAGAVATLVVTGVYQGWRETRALDALAGTAYGRLLLVKLGVFAVLLAVAGVATVLVRRSRQVTADAAALGHLRRTVAMEALLGVAVLAVTSFLVATPPARSTFGPPFSATVQGRNVDGTPIKVSLDITPTRAGVQSIRLRAYSLTGQPLPFISATGELTRGGAEGPVRFTFTAVTDGEGLAPAVVVPQPGRWNLTVQVLTDTTTDYAATTDYTVR